MQCLISIFPQNFQFFRIQKPVILWVGICDFCTQKILHLICRNRLFNELWVSWTDKKSFEAQIIFLFSCKTPWDTSSQMYPLTWKHLETGLNLVFMFWLQKDKSVEQNRNIFASNWPKIFFASSFEKWFFLFLRQLTIYSCFSSDIRCNFSRLDGDTEHRTVNFWQIFIFWCAKMLQIYFHSCQT